MSGPWTLGFMNSHNAAVCLLRGQELVVAIQEERLTRFKRSEFPPGEMPLAVQYCLERAQIKSSDVDLVAGCDFPHDFQSANWFRETWPNAIWVPHHLAHAYGVFATSGLPEAAIMVIDGEGGPRCTLPESELSCDLYDARTTIGTPFEVVSMYVADRSSIRPVEKHFGACHGPRREDGRGDTFASLGGLFDAAAVRIFADPFGAGKVMGLAPYGSARFSLEDLVDLDAAGPLRFLGPERVPEAFAARVRPWPDDAEQHRDASYACQAAFERVVLALMRRLATRTKHQRLCYAGGCALNSVANEKILRAGLFTDAYIMPAAEDSGAAIGAAYYALHLHGQTRTIASRRIDRDSCGSSYTDAQIDRAIERTPGLEVKARDFERSIQIAVEMLDSRKIIGWFSGGSELGPRSLGQRSILCDPRREDGKDYVNARVKFREAFRPFAPAVLREAVADWFECEPQTDSPFMLRVMKFRQGRGERVPAVHHIDGTGRVQTVCRDRDPAFYALIHQFHERTGIPMLLNTSFNIRGEPIIETPEDALWGLLSTGLDACVLDGRLVAKLDGYRGIMGLYGHQVGRLVCSAWPIDGSIVEPGVPTIVIQTATPWGPIRHALTPEDYTVLQLCDGNHNGWHILEALAKQGVDHLSHAYDEAQLVMVLGRLRRARLIEFAARSATQTAGADRRESGAAKPDQSASLGWDRHSSIVINRISTVGTSERPVSIVRADGAHLYSQDGRRLIDLTGSYGAVLVGHNHPSVRQAIERALLQGNSITTGYSLATQVAESLIDSVVSDDARRGANPAVAFYRTGTSAVRAAAHALRMHTGHRLILSSGFHGWDPMWTPGRPFEPNADGVYDFFYAVDLLDEMLERHRGKIAGVVVSPDYVHLDRSVLPAIYERCRAARVAVVSDEVLYGFRWAYGPSIASIGLSADVYTFSKSIANGAAIAAVIGNREIVAHLKETVSTLTYEPTALAAAAATLARLATLDAPALLQRESGRFAAAASRAFANARLPIETYGDGRMFHFIGTQDSARELYARLFEAGFHTSDYEYLSPSCAFQGVLVDHAIERFERMVDEFARARPDLIGGELSTEERWCGRWQRLDGFHGNPEIPAKERDAFIWRQFERGNWYGVG